MTKTISPSTLLLLVALLAASPASTGAPDAEAGGFDHSAWDRILRDVVVGEGIDYARVRSAHASKLERYLAAIAELDPAKLPDAERLALYINLYNATMVREVIARNAPGDWTPARDDFSVFDAPVVRVAGEALSLNRLEHEIIRKQFDEPRIHVALVCAARSCPSILPRAYAAADLDRVLERNMRRFVNDPARNRIDVRAKRLELSRIFDWYAEDFGGKAALARYVDRYTDADVSGFEVTFLDYSWELNRAN
ncbi:MAG: DUF547 domain-containing protein [bacterium]|nr:DUF547 domain-containing protein [bacterium]